MISSFIFQETSPSAPGVAVSSQPVTSAASYLPAGVAGPLDDVDSLDVVAELVGATGGTLDVVLQTSLDDGQTFSDAIHWPQLASGAPAVIYRCTQAFTGQPGSVAPVTIGKGTSPALAANVAVQGPWGTRARLVMTAGTLTTAGAAVRVTAAGTRPRNK